MIDRGVDGVHALAHRRRSFTIGLIVLLAISGCAGGSGPALHVGMADRGWRSPLDGASTELDRIGAEAVTSSSDGAVAILDTGIALHDPDLNVVTDTSCIDQHLSGDDDNGHGTHMATLIGGRGVPGGVRGVSPGIRLIAVKVLDDHEAGEPANLVCGLEWVAANAQQLGIAVAALSLATPGRDDGACGAVSGDPIHRAICRVIGAGVALVAAAGNEARSLSDYVPAAYSEVLTVTAIADSDDRPGGVGPPPACDPRQRDDTVFASSNYATSSKAHLLAAPGVCVLSASPRARGGRVVVGGTSVATALVAGALAECAGSRSSPGPCTAATPLERVRRLEERARDHALADPGYGFVGDPLHPISSRSYGYLVWAGP